MTKVKVDFKSMLTDAAIVACIGSVHKRADTLQLDVHRILVAIAAKWQKCGDIRPAVVQVNMLIDDMPKGVRSNALREWVELYFGFTIAVDGVNKDKFTKEGAVKPDTLDLKELANKRWFDVSKEAPYKPIDFGKDLEKLLKRGGERVNSTKGDAVDAKLLQAVQAAVAAHQRELEVAAQAGKLAAADPLTA